MDEYILKGERLDFAYPDGTKVLKDLNIAIPKGKKVAILGANGAGKSTLFLHFIGIYRPQNGTVYYQGKPISYQKKELNFLRSKVGIVFQDPDVQLFAANVYQEVSFGPLNLGLDKSTAKKRVEKALEITGITHLQDKPTQFLSYGQKKIVCLADILAMQPEVFILDEPTAWLDPMHTEKVIRILSNLNEEGKTVIISTHDLEFAYGWADYIFILQDGKVILEGKPEDLLTNEESTGKRDNLGIVWKEGRYWRRGITTGTCAAAGAKAALNLLLKGDKCSEVLVELPSGQKIVVPVKNLVFQNDAACCTVIKDGGDDPDVTTGLPIITQVQLQDSNKITILGGQGVGRVTKPGLSIPPGQAAINPVPRMMIEKNARKILGSEKGAIIKISVPGGEQAAKHTLNPRLGILGGISILGTSGIVEPMSEEAFKNSLVGSINQVKALEKDTLVLVPGRMGEKTAGERFNIPSEFVVHMSNFVGFMLERAWKEGFRKLLIIGHIGKTVKLAAGIFHTHSRQADGRLETMAAYLGTLGADSSLLQEVLDQTTTESAVNLIKNKGYSQLFTLLAEKGEKRCREFLKDEVEEIGLVMTDLQGNPLGVSSGARKLEGEMGWRIE